MAETFSEKVYHVGERSSPTHEKAKSFLNETVH